MTTESRTNTEPEQKLRDIEPLDPAITSIQPGGGVCMRLELAWGRMRRWYLRRFRPRYVARMGALRQGSINDRYPTDILDPRDLKFYRNQGDLDWQAADDPFRWRDRLPFVRVGLAELLLMGGACALAALLLVWLLWPLAALPLVLLLFFMWFFRDPERDIPDDAGSVVSPADGRVFSVREVEYDEYLAAPAVVIDIFLSVFNVHVNRAPMAGRVTGLSYRPGKFLNALRPEAARENECLEVRLVSTTAPYRAARVRQITGAIARRIVCWVAPGQHLPKGERFGMIKLGSRTELTIPREPGMEIRVAVGQKVSAGATILAAYRAPVSE